jgi:hypothetical protein
MSVNRIGHLVMPSQLADKYQPAAALLEAAMTAPLCGLLVSGAVRQHPGEQCTLVVLHMDVQISQDLVRHMQHQERIQEEVAMQAEGWQAAGMPPLYAFVGSSEMGAKVAQFLATNEAQALVQFDALRQVVDVVGMCVAPGGMVMTPLQLVDGWAADAERARRLARARRAGR